MREWVLAPNVGMGTDAQVHWSVIDGKVRIQPRVISRPMARIHRGLRGITGLNNILQL